MNLYRLQFGSGEPLCEWVDTGNPLASLEWALGVLRHLTRTDAIFAWRIVNQDDVRIAMVVPGVAGAA